jgi:hypothetical protein
MLPTQRLALALACWMANLIGYRLPSRYLSVVHTLASARKPTDHCRTLAVNRDCLAMLGVRASTRSCGGDFYVENLNRESLYSIHMATRVFCAAYKKLGGWDVYTKKEGSA